MAVFTKQIIANLDPYFTGKTGVIGYTIKDTAGNPLVARTTAGIAESTALGTYVASVPVFDRGWSGRIEWDAGAGLLAAEAIVPMTYSNVIIRQGIATLDPLLTGLTGTLGITVKDPAGNVITARSTAGIVESGTSAFYFVALANFNNAIPGRIEWDAGAGLLAVEDFFPGSGPVHVVRGRLGDRQ